MTTQALITEDIAAEGLDWITAPARRRSRLCWRAARCNCRCSTSATWSSSRHPSSPPSVRGVPHSRPRRTATGSAPTRSPPPRAISPASGSRHTPSLSIAWHRRDRARGWRSDQPTQRRPSILLSTSRTRASALPASHRSDRCRGGDRSKSPRRAHQSACGELRRRDDGAQLQITRSGGEGFSVSPRRPSNCRSGRVNHWLADRLRDECCTPAFPLERDMRQRLVPMLFDEQRQVGCRSTCTSVGGTGATLARRRHQADHRPEADGLPVHSFRSARWPIWVDAGAQQRTTAITPT